MMNFFRVRLSRFLFFIDKISINIPVQVYFEWLEGGKTKSEKERGEENDDDEVPVAFVKLLFSNSRYGILRNE